MFDKSFLAQTPYASFPPPEDRLRVAVNALGDLHERLKSDAINRTEILYQIQMNGVRMKVLIGEIVNETSSVSV